ncbi:hypothetical protein TWF696_002527 [Orbilia brochopaga]|uniref:DNA recombination and repair protein Rad51-like C-terminal domain-containing protein n=1 Tax=Orbilia brochopaga TaxID=3140254 RepID=A0AAV9U5V5_9PEZI
MYLLSDVRLAAQHHNPAAGPFHVPAIDALLQLHLHDHLYNQSIAAAAEAAAAAGGGAFGSSAVDGYFDFDADNVPRDRPAIVEISADRPCAGKTHLLYHFACIAVLPTSWNGITLDGKDGAVVFIDCDGRFDILRLAAITEAYVHTRLARAIQFCRSAAEEHSDPDLDDYLSLLLSITDSHVAELTEYVLAHVHVYTPESTPQLLDILAAIPSHLTASPSHNRPLCSILIDGISAFYWLDRRSPLPASFSSSPLPASDTPPPLQQPPKQSQLPSPLQARYETLTTTLRNLSTRFGASVVLTNTFVVTAAATAPSSTIANTPPFPRHLPACYTYSSKFLTARIILSPDVVAPFRTPIELQEAHAEREMRRQAVRRAGISAWVGGAGRTVDGGTAGGDWFWFQISDGGVQIDDEEHEDDGGDNGDGDPADEHDEEEGEDAMDPSAVE